MGNEDSNYPLLGNIVSGCTSYYSAPFCTHNPKIMTVSVNQWEITFCPALLGELSFSRVNMSGYSLPNTA